MKEILAEIKEYKCNKCTYNGEIYEFMEISGIYFLLKDFRQTGIKLNKKEGQNAVIKYWLNHKDDFIKEKDKKEKDYIHKRKEKILEDFFDRAKQFEQYQKTKNWKELIPNSFYLMLIAFMDNGTIEKDIVAQYEKIIKEYPEFVEKAKEINAISDIKEQFKEYQIYFKIGIYKYHKRNIDSLLDSVNDCIKDTELEQSKNESNTNLLQIVKQRFENALLKNHKKENSKKSLDEYRKYFLDILMPEFITHCYYGNEIHEFTGENEITVNGEKINLEKELADWGARAYRMSIEANRVIDEKRLENIFN